MSKTSKSAILCGMFRVLSAIALFATLTSFAVSPKPTRAPKRGNTILDSLQASWDKTQTYQADFKQTVTAKHMSDEETSSGSLMIAKPENLRWDVTSTGVSQILTGGKLYVIQPNKRRKNRTVDIYTVGTKSFNFPALGFLSGKAKFADRYHVKTIKDTPRVAELRFSPKDGSRETLIAEVDKHGYVLRSLTTESADSQIKVVFSNEKLDPQFEEGVFEYKQQPGDIVQAQ